MMFILMCLYLVSASVDPSSFKRGRSPTIQDEVNEDKLRREEEPSWEAWVDIVKSFPITESAEVIIPLLPWNSSFISEFKTKVVERIRLDEADSFSPSLNDLENQLTPLGNIALNKRTIQCATETSTIHFFKINEDLNVIKFQTDCLEEFTTIHPLMIDYWFLEYLEPFNIAPKPKFLSPPSVLQGPVRTTKTAFQMERDVFLGCLFYGATVRYAIMTKQGNDLHTYMIKQPGGRVPIGDALRLGVQLLHLLEKLHEEAGVIHGDIHTGNVVIDNSNTLQLIDFARSKFVSSTLNDERVREPMEWVDALLSVWETDGYPPGRRDDVFRALLAIIITINGHSFYEYLSSDLTRAHTIKSEENMYFSAPQFNPLAELRLPETERKSVEGHLGKSLEISRNVPLRSQTPQYQLIRDQLQAALDIIEPRVG